jgi:formate dehydrogenase iron-sulfur subunit
MNLSNKGKSFFIDLSICMGCRGCQIACKEWHELPATKTKQTGSYENPPDLNFYTYKTVHFVETEINNNLKWLFFPEQCRHCIYPACKDAADGYVKGAIVKDEDTGAVIFNIELLKKVPYEVLITACPYKIPREDKKTGKKSKCDMCIDRVKDGLLPICVKTCPNKAMHFGDRKDMLALANERLKEVKKEWPNAQLVDSGEIRVIYLTVDKPKYYHPYLAAETPFKPY